MQRKTGSYILFVEIPLLATSISIILHEISTYRVIVLITGVTVANWSTLCIL